LNGGVDGAPDVIVKAPFILSLSKDVFSARIVQGAEQCFDKLSTNGSGGHDHAWPTRE